MGIAYMFNRQELESIYKAGWIRGVAIASSLEIEDIETQQYNDVSHYFSTLDPKPEPTGRKTQPLTCPPNVDDSKRKRRWWPW